MVNSVCLDTPFGTSWHLSKNAPYIYLLTYLLKDYWFSDRKGIQCVKYADLAVCFVFLGALTISVEARKLLLKWSSVYMFINFSHRVWLQLEEDKKKIEDELTEKKNALALQLASTGDQHPSKVCWLAGVYLALCASTLDNRCMKIFLSIVVDEVWRKSC